MSDRNKRLKPSQLRTLSLAFDPFIKTVELQCSSHTFYRGEIFCDEEGDLICNLVASDAGGVISTVSMHIILSNNHAFLTSKNLEFDSEAAVKKALFDLVSTLETLPVSINTVYFDFYRRFSKGSMEESKVPGEVNLYLLGDCDMHLLLTEDSEEVKDVNEVLGSSWEARG